MSSAAELLALTDTAVQSLLNAGTTDNVEGTPLQDCTIFSPLADSHTHSVAAPPSDHAHSGAAPPLPVDHTPLTTAPSTASVSTPSPLTITAHDVSPEDEEEAEAVKEDGMRPWAAGSTPHRTVTTVHSSRSIPYPAPSTPHTGVVTPNSLTPHSTEAPVGSTTPGAGRVRIKVSAKKVREIPSPLASPSPSHTQLEVGGDSQGGAQVRESPVARSPLSCVGSLCSGDTPRALNRDDSHPPPLSPSSSLSHGDRDSTAHPSNNDAVNRQSTAVTHKSKHLAQGVMKTTTHTASPDDTSLENSLIVSQIESAVPTHHIKEKLLEQQTQQKRLRFKVVQPRMIAQQPEKTLGRRETKEGSKSNASSPYPQKARRVGGERDVQHSRLQLNESRVSKPLARTGTDLTKHPVSYLPPPSTLASQLNPDPANIPFPVNPMKPCGHPPPDRGIQAEGFLANATPRRHPEQRKQFPSVSCYSDNVDLFDREPCTGDSPSTMASVTTASQTSQTSGVSLPPHTLPRLHRDVTSQRNPPLDFEETVRLVASCTAAATAAVISAQRGSREEAKMAHDIQHQVSLPNSTSKEIKVHSTMHRNRPTTCTQTATGAPPTSSCVPLPLPPSPPPPPSLPPPSHPLRGTSGAGERNIRGGGGVFSTHKLQEESKAPTLEKPTALFTLAPLQSQSGGGFETEYKHPTLLNNQTSLATERCEKTQEDANYYKHRQGSPSLNDPCSRNDVNGSRASGLEGLHEQISGMQPPQLCDRKSPSLSTHQHMLGEVENKLMEIQQARKDLELDAALSEVQAGWSHTPPVPSDDPIDLNIPKRRVAVFMNQLRERVPSGHSAMSSHDNEGEEVTSLPILSGKRQGRFQQSGASRLQGGGKKGKVILPKGLGRTQGGCISQSAKQKGREANKERCPVRKPHTRKPKPSRTKTPASDTGGRLEQQKEGNSLSGVDTRGDIPFEPLQKQIRIRQLGPVPPPSLPLLHSQVRAPLGIAGAGMPVSGYTLPPGVVACDPTTGVPLSAVFLPPPPPPPCVHMPTAIPLAPPSTVRPTTVPLAESPDDPTAASWVSKADVCLQTSFKESGTTSTTASPHLVQETNSRENSEELSSHNTSIPVRAEDEDLHLNSSLANLNGISLIGNQSGTSPSDSENGPLVQSSQQQCMVTKPQMSTDEINRTIIEYLESHVTERVTQELLTRVLAAAQSHDMSHDQNALQRTNSLSNSCSTCTSPSHPPSLTIPHLHHDITGRASVDGAVVGVCDSGASGGEGVKGDVVVVEVVREVIWERVAAALRETQSGQRREEEEEKELLFNEEDASHGQSDDSAQTTPHILTPSPSPPPQHSPPPSPSSHDTSPHLQLATPTTTPPISPRSNSTLTTPPHILTTPQETEEDMSVKTTTEVIPAVQDGAPTCSQHTLPTPTPSPPHQAPPIPSPPSLTKQEDSSRTPPLSHHTPLLHPQFDLSESPSPTSSSTTTSTKPHPHPHTLTPTTNLTTDQEISVGEGVLVRPPLPGATNSLSEGEVALSPGDACWYATYASKIGQLGVQGARHKTDNHPKKSKVTPVVAAFLELKNSPDSLCDTSDYSSSFKSDSNVASEGEVKVQQRHRGRGDPLDRFLSNLQASSPETSSTPTPPISEDNTLSDLPSLAGDDKSNTSCGEVKEKKKKKSTLIRPLNSKLVGEHHSIGSVVGEATVPYHRKFPLGESKSASPGEIRSKSSVQLGLVRDKGDGELGLLALSHSEGQVHPTVHQRMRSSEEKSKQPLPNVVSVSSPGELRVKLNTSNRTRNGVDVITVSKSSSPKSYSSFSRRDVSGSTSTPSHPILSSLTTSHSQPATTPSRRLRVREELEPARIIPVASSLAKEEEDLPGGEIEPADIGQGPHMTVTSAVPSSPSQPNASSPRLPALETLLQTSSSSSDNVSPPLPLSDKSTQQPPNSTTAAAAAANRQSSPGLCLSDTRLQEFWDRPSLPQATLRQPPSTGSRAIKVQEGEMETASAVALHAAQAAHLRQREGLPVQQGRGAGAAQDSAVLRLNTAGEPEETTDKEDEGTTEGFKFKPSPTKTQLEISVPMATREESLPTSPVPSPTYSSDFDFSSISQPTFH